MKDANRITDFVKDICSRYSILPEEHFYTYDENDQLVPSTLFKDSIVTPDALDCLGKLIGVKAEDVAAADYDVALKFYNKHPFFNLLLKYEECKKISKLKINSDYIHSEDQKFLYRILGNENLVPKYSEDNLRERLIAKLKECDKVIPGTFHPNGEITSFIHEEETLIDFPEYEQMMKSFFEIYDRMASLFFKALRIDLQQDEINEYNLFVSYFRAKEWISGSTNLYYDVLVKYRDVYIREGYNQISSYIRINRGATDFEPWKCKQFADHREYAQRYQDLYPGTKDKIKDLCMHIKYISCCFKWSDAPYIDEDDDDCISDSYRTGKYQEWTHVYIPKTKAEIGSDAKSTIDLRKFASPVSKGGLEKKKDELVVYDTDLWMKRYELRKGCE